MSPSPDVIAEPMGDRGRNFLFQMCHDGITSGCRQTYRGRGGWADEEEEGGGQMERLTPA